MNTKVANVIAVELGILIVILAWLAFSNFSRVKQPTLAKEQEPAERQAQTLQYETMQYDQQLASAPDTSANADDSVTTGTSPYYAGVYPQPVTSPDSFAWPYDPVLVYPPTSEIIVISNGQAFVRRGAPRFARRPMTVVHRRPPGGGGARTANPRSFRPSAGLRPR